MRIDSLFYRLAYRSGTPRWDSTEPRPELAELAKGRAPGRALDLGCGTGSDVLYLASLGWDATGVDFVPRAIAAARSRAAASGSSASFTVGDVTRLREAGVGGQFDLVIDIGCYHAIPASHRDAYRDEVAAVTRPGGDLYLAGVTDPPATWRLLGARGLGAGDLRRRFGPDFELAGEQTAGRIGRAGTFVFYHLVRKRPGAADAAGDITAAPVSTGPGSERPAQRLRASCGARAQCHLQWLAGLSGRAVWHGRTGPGLGDHA
jgi:SAM-dependent methyltransferase